MTVHRLHYVLAASSEAALALAALIDLGRIPPMATCPASLFALLANHPLGYRERLAAFLVYTGNSGLASKRLVPLDR